MSVSSIGSLEVRKLSPSVGAEILNVDLARIREDDELPHLVLEALDAYGVLLFKGLHIDDDAQAAFAHQLGRVRLYPDLPKPEIFEVSYNKDNPYGSQLRGNINWHLDGLADQDSPGKATMLSAKVVAPTGGETEFASSYGGTTS